MTRRVGVAEAHALAPALLAFTAGILGTSCALPLSSTSSGAGSGELWMLSVDNDSYSFDDGNYTSGVELLWVSASSEGEQAGEFARSVVAASDWLPGLGGGSHHAALVLRHIVSTPERLTVRNPGPDERPYAGVLLWDTAVVAVGDRASTGYVLRLGVLGEPSFAEEFQEQIHPIFGAEDPRGWSTQLPDEPVVNIGWTHRRRLGSEDPVAGRFDLMPELAAHLGTYYTGASVALRLRYGADLPPTLAPLPPRTGFEIHPLAGQPSGPSSSWYGFLDAEAHGVAHYLLLDGNVFRDSREAERAPFVAKGALGVSLGRGPWVLTLAYSVLTDAYGAQDRVGQFGTISLAWTR